MNTSDIYRRFQEKLETSLQDVLAEHELTVELDSLRKHITNDSSLKFDVTKLIPEFIELVQNHCPALYEILGFYMNDEVLKYFPIAKSTENGFLMDFLNVCLIEYMCELTLGLDSQFKDVAKLSLIPNLR